MNNAYYHAWLVANFPIVNDKDKFTAFLSIKTINLLGQSNSSAKLHV